MSHREKDNLISLVATLAISVPYLIYVINKYNGETFTTEEEMKFFATAFLILIPIRIVGEIILNILFAIGYAIITGKEDADETVDERDKLIELKSTRNSHYTFAIGFLTAIAIIAAGGTLSVVFIVAVIAGLVAELVEIFSQIFYSRKGV